MIEEINITYIHIQIKSHKIGDGDDNEKECKDGYNIIDIYITMIFEF